MIMLDRVSPTVNHAPLPLAHQPAMQFINAKVVLPHAVVDGVVQCADGQIVAVTDRTEAGFQTVDLGGAFLIPGIVDVHTDHAETHVRPRSTVLWKFLPALMAHDGVVISGGTTTVFDSLSVGASMQKLERREILEPLVEAMEYGREHAMFRADHLLHMRCEISDPTTVSLVDAIMGKDIARLVSVMDHTPGDRQSPDVERWFHHMIHEMEISEAEGRERMAELFERSAREGARVRAHVVEAAHRHDVPLMSHDDRSIEHVDQAKAEGVSVSEFPTTLEAARRAKELGLANVAGAPNYVRGGSQSGNIAVKDLLAEGLVDALASDYVPRSLLDAAFGIAADATLDYSLPQTIAMVADTPAKMTGLADRGRIEIGLRADLVAVDVVGDQPCVRAVWREGYHVF